MSFQSKNSDSNSTGSKRFDLDSHLTGAVAVASAPTLQPARC